MAFVGRTLKYLGAAGITVGVLEACIYDVDAGTRAVIFDKAFGGIQKHVIGEGTHFRIPILQEPIIIDVRSRPRVINSATGTKDLQMVNISLRVLSRPDENELSTIYQTLGSDFDERILPSIANEVLKSVVAQYNAEELLSKREEVSNLIRENLLFRAKQFNLLLDDVAITHLTFGREFARAIEHKQVAQQEAETQLYVVAKAEQERQAAVIRAEGEAEAGLLISKAMDRAGNGFVEVRRLDAAKEVAMTLAKSRNVTYLPNGGKEGGSNLLLSVGGNAGGAN